jgi:hypothetical protein
MLIGRYQGDRGAISLIELSMWERDDENCSAIDPSIVYALFIVAGAVRPFSV